MAQLKPPPVVGSQGKRPGEWVGSRYIGPQQPAQQTPPPTAPPGPMAPPTSTVPPSRGSQGRRAGEWIGSRYIGPAQPAQPPPQPIQPILPLPPNSPYLPNMNNSEGNWGTNPPTPPVLQPPPVAPLPTTGPGSLAYSQQNYWAADREAHLADPERVRQFGATATTGPAYTGSAYVGTPANSNMQGFDARKLADPRLGTSHKYVGGRYLQQNPGNIGGMLQLPEFAGWTQISGDKIRSPEGSIYDVRNSNGAVQWVYISGGPRGPRNDGIPGNDPHGGAQVGGGQGGGGGGGAPVPNPLPPVPGTPSPGGPGIGDYNSLLEQSFRKLLEGNQSPLALETEAALLERIRQ